jgi:hypothetical protein
MESLLKFRPKKDYICNKTGLAWLKLDITVPVEEIHNEFKNCADQVVSHRSNDEWANLSHKGWCSATLYGVNSTTTTNSNLQHSWTKLADQCPKTTKWINNNFTISKSTGRIRFMLLEPGGYILPHHDRDNSGLREVNVAITQPNGCVFRFLDRGTIPFCEGDAYIIDTSNKHLVWNNSDQYRLHMILHTHIEDKILEDSYANRFYST